MTEKERKTCTVVHSISYFSAVSLSRLRYYFFSVTREPVSLFTFSLPVFVIHALLCLCVCAKPIHSISPSYCSSAGVSISLCVCCSSRRTNKKEEERGRPYKRSEREEDRIRGARRGERAGIDERGQKVFHPSISTEWESSESNNAQLRVKRRQRQKRKSRFFMLRSSNCSIGSALSLSLSFGGKSRGHALVHVSLLLFILSSFFSVSPVCPRAFPAL